MIEFAPFPKIPRLSRSVVVTEKIDGTNAQICIGEDGSIQAGSRNRWISPTADNCGFAAWVEAHKDELMQLGPGRHYGEWWGQGIQRRYGLTEKRFSLFNVNRWETNPPPACCSVVPVLWRGLYDDMPLDALVNDLRTNGSKAAPGFMQPEGIVVFHIAAKQMFKKLLENDDISKTEADA